MSVLQDAAERRRALELVVSEMQKRQADDPLRAFRPTEPQRPFIRSVLYGEHKENYLFGANRSGKTLAGAYLGATLARFGYPDDSPLAARFVRGQDSDIAVRDRATAGWVSALDFSMSRDVVQPAYFDNGHVSPGSRPFIPAWEIADWSVTNQTLHLKNGSLIGFKSADSGRRKYQGAAKDWVHLDEEHDEGVVDEITIRVGKRPLNLFTAATLLPPEGIQTGSSWLYQKVIVPWKKGLLPHIGIFTSSIYDNPHVPRQEIERLEAKFADGSVQRRIRLGGELLPGMGGARIYSSFRHEANIKRQTEVHPFTPLAFCWDFNVEPMPTVVGQRLGGIFHVYKEFFLEEGNIGEMCELFRSEYPTHPGGVFLYGDSSGHARSNQSGRSNWTLVLQNFQSYPGSVKLKVPFTNPAVTDRINAVNVACLGSDGISRLQIDEKCEELIADFDGVVSDGKGGIKKSRRRSDPYYRRTHVSDALGYWIVMEAPVGSHASMEVPRWGSIGGQAQSGVVQIPRPGYRTR